MKVLKNAAKTRKVPKEEVLSALSVIEKTKLDPSGFLNTLGGSKSPGRTWMLIFTAEVDLNQFIIPFFGFAFHPYLQSWCFIISFSFYFFVPTAETVKGWWILPSHCCSEV